jgi:plastocyanin
MKRLKEQITRASRITRAVLAVAAFVAVGGAALMPLIANPARGPHEIVLVVKDMAFFVEGSDIANPTIHLKPSEEVRVIITNQDAGIIHAFAAAKMSLGRIEPGATKRFSLRAPAEPGRYEYNCPPHAQMMKGVLLVAAE